MSRSTSGLPVAAAAVAVATVIAVAGSNALSSASSGGDPGQAKMQDAARFADCVRSHGVPDFPDPSSPREFKLSMSPDGGGKPRSPAFQAAQTACEHVLPSGGPPKLSAAQRHTQLVAGQALARCMRARGIANFPDPTSDGQLTHEMLAAAGVDPRQPTVLRAADACVGVTQGLLTKADVARFAAGH
jgi:hypothetical protein